MAGRPHGLAVILSGRLLGGREGSLDAEGMACA